MPATHKIYAEQNLVYVTFSGSLTLPEILTDYMAYYANKDWRHGQSVFVDTSTVTEFKVTFQGLVAILKHLIGVLDPFEATILTAIYAPSDMMYAKGKLHQRLTSNSGANCVGVFRDKADAWAFLDIPSDELPNELQSAPINP